MDDYAIAATDERKFRKVAAFFGEFIEKLITCVNITGCEVVDDWFKVTNSFRGDVLAHIRLCFTSLVQLIA
jgi:hypothetical protein